MSKPRILLQLDTDSQPSVFDAVVAVDAGVAQLLRHHGVTEQNVRDLVYGAMFTRAPADLSSTAIFIGGANVTLAEAVLDVVKRTFLGPVRVSVMLDANGANTTAAAAVLTASKHLPPVGAKALVLGGTGPVGQRVARLLARAGADVRIGSRDIDRAEGVCHAIRERLTSSNGSPSSGGPSAFGRLAAVSTATPDETRAALDEVQIVIAAGAPGVVLLPSEVRRSAASLQVAIDLNAVPPLGIEGIEATDKAVEREEIVCYGAIGVGGMKMKIHKAALRRLFESNTVVLDAEEIFELGQRQLAAGG